MHQIPTIINTMLEYVILLYSCQSNVYEEDVTQYRYMVYVYYQRLSSTDSGSFRFL